MLDVGPLNPITSSFILKFSSITNMTIYSTYEYDIRTIVICISAQIAKFNVVSNPMNSISTTSTIYLFSFPSSQEGQGTQIQYNSTSQKMGKNKITLQYVQILRLDITASERC